MFGASHSVTDTEAAARGSFVVAKCILRFLLRPSTAFTFYDQCYPKCDQWVTTEQSVARTLLITPNTTQVA